MVEFLLRRQRRRLEVVSQRLRVRQQTVKAGLHDSRVLLERKLGSRLGLAVCFCAGFLAGRLGPKASQLKHSFPMNRLSAHNLSVLARLLRGGL
jgi:hypothetical protein